MMKKIANILFLILTTLFLTHAVVPHRHHNSMISIENSHQTHKHHSDSNDHQHNGNNDVQSCILYRVIPNQNNQTQKILKCGNCNTNFPILIFAVLFSEIENNPVKTADYLYFPIIQSDYSVFVSKCSGLRAPPIV